MQLPVFFSLVAFFSSSVLYIEVAEDAKSLLSCVCAQARCNNLYNNRESEGHGDPFFSFIDSASVYSAWMPTLIPSLLYGQVVLFFFFPVRLSLDE